MADMTRWEFAQRLARELGLVDDNASGREAADALAAEGIIDQAGDGFNGGDTVTRAQAATMFSRAAGSDAGNLAEGLSTAGELGLFTSVDPGAGGDAFNSDFFDDVFERGVDADLFEFGASFEDELRERFPGQAWALDHPELGPIIVRAVREEWSPATLESKIVASQWYTTRIEAERIFDIAEETDPGSNADALADARRVVDRRVSVMGASLSEEDRVELARRIARSGIDEFEITGFIFDHAEGEFVAGDFVAAQTAVRSAADSFLTRLTDDEARDAARRVMLGEVTAEGLREEYAVRAKSRFPSLAELIDNGTNLSDYFSDHKQRIAAMMGEDIDSIDLLDNQWAPVLGFSDSSGAAPRPMAAHEVDRFIRGTDEFYATANGRAELNDSILQLQSAMGVR